jgi:uncharacterized repeat protein (TIGR04138 family)
MQRISFEDELANILARDPRYRLEAYAFVREALDHTQQMMGRPPPNEIRHVTGRQLLEGARHYALTQYGPMALLVLEEWGIRSCEDIGEIVFNMVEANLLAKTDEDSRDDFKGAYDFQEAFREPFLPSGSRQTASSKPRPG